MIKRLGLLLALGFLSAPAHAIVMDHGNLRAFMQVTAAAALSGQTTSYYDTYTDIQSSPAAHAPDLSFNATTGYMGTDAATGNLTVKGNALTTANSTADYRIWLATPTSADSDIFFDSWLNNALSTCRNRVEWRWGISTQNGYELEHNATSLTTQPWQLSSVAAGTRTLIASGTVSGVLGSAAAATWYSWRVRTVGNQFSLWLKTQAGASWTQILNGTVDNTYSAAGAIAIQVRNTQQFDNLKVLSAP